MVPLVFGFLPVKVQFLVLAHLLLHSSSVKNREENQLFPIPYCFLGGMFSSFGSTFKTAGVFL